MALADIHVPFLPAVKLWLQALQEQVKCRLQSAVEGDTVSKQWICGMLGFLGLPPCANFLLPSQLEPTDTSSKHSSSAATASLCFSHIQELWVRLAWPDPAQAQELGTQLSQVCGSGEGLARKKLHTVGCM